MRNNIKYFVSLIALLAVFICVGELVMAENYEVIKNEMSEEMEVIKAEDIGVKAVEKEMETETVIAEAVAEDKVVDEAPVYKEEVSEPIEDVEEPEYKSPEVPEGLVEGVYFEPNSECEISEECYKCEECDFREELFIDEDINPEGEHWVLGKTCVVCGHGINEPVSEEFVCEHEN